MVPRQIRSASFTIRQRLTLLLTCSMHTRRRANARLAAFCSGVRVPPRGFLVGSSISTPSNVKARKPKSWSNWLSGGKGYAE